MHALAIVEDLDVLEDGALGGHSRGPDAAVEQLLLERGEEALRYGVVSVLSGPGERLHEAVPRK